MATKKVGMDDYETPYQPYSFMKSTTFGERYVLILHTLKVMHWLNLISFFVGCEAVKTLRKEKQ